MGVYDHARRALGEQRVRELPEDGRTVPQPQELGWTDGEVDTQRAEGLVLIGMEVLEVRIVALQIGDRPAAK